MPCGGQHPLVSLGTKPEERLGANRHCSARMGFRRALPYPVPLFLCLSQRCFSYLASDLRIGDLIFRSLHFFFFFFLKALSSVMSYCKKTIESPLNKDWECHLHLLNPAVSIYLCRTELTCFLTWRCKLPFPVMH